MGEPADNFWVARLRDNRIKGLASELSDAIADCDDPDLLHQLRTTLRVGLATQAALREDEIRDADRKGKLSAVSRRARRLGRRTA